MKRWTNGLPGATKRLGAMMAIRGLSLSQPRMRADTHDGPEQIAPLQRPDTLMQLSRSLSWKSILYRTAGPYKWHHEDRMPTHGYAATRDSAMAAFAESWWRE